MKTNFVLWIGSQANEEDSNLLGKANENVHNMWCDLTKYKTFNAWLSPGVQLCKKYKT